MTSSARSTVPGAPGASTAAPAPPGTHHRRHHSELDMNSLRRISEALLLAQNRARRATERANRSEHLLRAVFARVDSATAAALRLEMDALAGGDTAADWLPPTSQDDLALDVVVASPTSLTTRLLAGRRHTFDDELSDEEGENALEISQVAREIVANLGVAGARHRLLVDHVAKRVSADDSALAGAYCRLERRRPSSSASSAAPSRAPLLFLGVSPLQFVAGLLVGVCMGVTLTRFVAQPHTRQQSLVSKLSKWCSDRARVGRYYASASHALPFPLDDLGYFGHPTAIEVA